MNTVTTVTLSSIFAVKEMKKICQSPKEGVWVQREFFLKKGEVCLRGHRVLHAQRVIQ